MKIAKVLGTEELFIYLEKYDIELDSHFDELLGRYVALLPQQLLNEWFEEQNDAMKYFLQPHLTSLQ